MSVNKGKIVTTRTTVWEGEDEPSQKVGREFSDQNGSLSLDTQKQIQLVINGQETIYDVSNGITPALLEEIAQKMGITPNEAKNLLNGQKKATTSIKFYVDSNNRKISDFTKKKGEGDV
ncbi:MAG: hypothetical protein KC618_06515 [Candidatus Omnitrophica bacterium]|nr:hypothetical protein [Candidatus Omnitrophota bacterium]